MYEVPGLLELIGTVSVEVKVPYVFDVVPLGEMVLLVTGGVLLRLVLPG